MRLLGHHRRHGKHAAIRELQGEVAELRQAFALQAQAKAAARRVPPRPELAAAAGARVPGGQVVHVRDPDVLVLLGDKEDADPGEVTAYICRHGRAS